MELSVVLRDVSGKTGKGNIKIKIKKKGKNPTFIPTNYYIEPSFFDQGNGIIKKEFPEAAKWNSDLFAQKGRYQDYYKELGESVKDMSVMTLKQIFMSYDRIRLNLGKPVEQSTDFIRTIDKIIFDLESEEVTEEMKRKAYADTFRWTKNLLIKFFKTDKIYFQNIDSYTLIELKKFFLKGTNKKEVSFTKYLRCIRRVFKVAIGQKVISRDLYPFDAISIPLDYKAKIRKLDIEVLRKFYQRPGIGRDFFFLSFFLCGMNMKDIFYLPYFENYIDISRLKTARTAREVRLKLKLQPEILEIIKKYADPNKIRMIKTKYKNHKQLTHFIDDRIKSDIEEMNRNIKNEKDKIPHFSFTYARHSWATIAGQLRIPDSTIDKGLMHSVTGLMIEKYREYDYTQVDEANRKVIDYVLYKKTGE